MQIDMNCSTLTLELNGLLAVQDATGARIVCRSGSLWVTQEGEIKDWVMGPDDDLTIRRSGRTVVTALESASLTLIPPEAPGGGKWRHSDRADPQSFPAAEGHAAEKGDDNALKYSLKSTGLGDNLSNR